MGQSEDSKSFELLSELLLAPPSGSVNSICKGNGSGGASSAPDRVLETVVTLTQGELDDLRELATKNHVIMRAFEPLQRMLAASGKAEAARVGWTPP